MSERRRFLTLLVVLAGCWAMLASTRVQGQGEKKPYQQWTMKEAEDLLTESSWAQTLGGGVSVGGTDTPSAIRSPTVTIRLRSALPIRRALARVRQIKAKYDKMGDNDKAAIDAKNKPLLECAPCDDYYVITVSPGPGGSKGVPNILQTMSLARAKLNVQIANEKGETRELVNFVNPKVAGEDAVFFFARFDAKSEPLIGPANRKLIISFDPTIFEGSAMRVTTVEFDIAKMVSNGQVVF